MPEFELVGDEYDPRKAFDLPIAPQNSVEGWRNEVDAYYVRMRDFGTIETDEIFAELAAFSARASEIRGWLVRSQTRASNSFRTQEIDPFISECDRQFKLWSRYQAVREMDFRLSGGGV